MNITPDQADQWAQTATAGPWYVHTDRYNPEDPYGTFVYDDTGNMCIAVEPAGSDYRKADLELIAAAPDLAQTIAGMRTEWGVEQATGTTQWFRSRPMAEAHAQVHGCFRLVRRLVGPVEVAE